MDTEFLDWALADFSGYVAADELYDGPFCILSAVDNRCYKRILYEVLDHDPDHDDIRAFLGRLKTYPEVVCQGFFSCVVFWAQARVIRLPRLSVSWQRAWRTPRLRTDPVARGHAHKGLGLQSRLLLAADMPPQWF